LYLYKILAMMRRDSALARFWPRHCDCGDFTVSRILMH
jgi:hypothetical protein